MYVRLGQLGVIAGRIHLQSAWSAQQPIWAWVEWARNVITEPTDTKVQATNWRTPITVKIRHKSKGQTR